MKLASLVIAVSLATGSTAFAQKSEKKEKEASGHCEKTTNGKVEDIEAKDRADCKAKGGKWSKGSKSDHDHKH